MWVVDPYSSGVLEIPGIHSRGWFEWDLDIGRAREPLGEGPKGVWGAWDVPCLTNLTPPDQARVFLVLVDPCNMV